VAVTSVQAAAFSSRVTIGLVRAPIASTQVPSTGQFYVDWMYRNDHYLGSGHGLLTAGTPNVAVIDLKSKRKVGEAEDTLWLALTYTIGGTETTWSWNIIANVLLALP